MSLGKESSTIHTWGKQTSMIVNEFGEGEFYNSYLGKQYFKFGEVKFLKLKEVSISILGEAIF